MRCSGESTVAIVGCGASGTLTAIALARRSTALRRPVRIVLVDPRPANGQGVAYSTTDPRHLLNVPAGRLSALPDVPDDFVGWLRSHGVPTCAPADFVPRERFGSYLSDTLDVALEAGSAVVRWERHSRSVLSVDAVDGCERLVLDDNSSLLADLVVLAVGAPAPSTDWAPSTLAGSASLVVDPWAPGVLARLSGTDGDLLLVGTGLTMADVALSTLRPDRTVHVVSRRGRFPEPHARGPVQVLPASEICGATGPLTLSDLRHVMRSRVEESLRRYGDWRPAVDGMRPVTAALWQQLGDRDRAVFLRRDASWWDVHRHRLAPDVAVAIQGAEADGRLVRHQGRVVASVARGSSVRVALSDGSAPVVTSVVNCTGPVAGTGRRVDLLARLVSRGRARPGPAGLGVDTDPQGRVLGPEGQASSTLLTLGPPRLGNLWETTAIPEIRVQSHLLAALLLPEPDSAVATAAKAQPRHRRSEDSLGLALSTTSDAAAAYRDGLDRLLRVQSGAEECLVEAVEADPTFALGHAVLAVLAAERGQPDGALSHLSVAQDLARSRSDERERSFVHAVAHLLRSDGPEPGAALLRHVQEHPRDALAASIAVPTIAFSGATDIPEHAWSLIERLQPAYGEHWWFLGMLAFVRQEQQRWDEAAGLAEAALTVEPGSGHAVHARAHVFYETGEHQAGLDFMDPWIQTSGRQACHRAHFSWHAALHELALGRPDALRRRYDSQISPASGVVGVRALVDAASLLWRCELRDEWRDDLPIDDVLQVVDPDLLTRPCTPFVAMHSAVALAAAGDGERLRLLQAHALSSPSVLWTDVVARLCAGLAAFVERRYTDSAADLYAVHPRLGALGGSAAQREIIEETLLHALLNAGWLDEAQIVLARRLDRKADRSVRSPV
jgi:uncharacterized NAD(P)/FAD-binding protein YdhS